MGFNRGLFQSQSGDWSTPRALFQGLEAEIGGFDLDPCPNGGSGGLEQPWEGKVFVNPPYGKAISGWIKKGYESAQEGALVVMLLPSRTDTRWWHEYVMKAHQEGWGQIRFIKGRLKFGEAKNSAPFPSCVVIFGSQALEAKQ